MEYWQKWQVAAREGRLERGFRDSNLTKARAGTHSEVLVHRVAKIKDSDRDEAPKSLFMQGCSLLEFLATIRGYLP